MWALLYKSFACTSYFIFEKHFIPRNMLFFLYIQYELYFHYVIFMFSYIIITVYSSHTIYAIQCRAEIVNISQ